MQCEAVQELLPEYVAGTLPDDERRAVEAHLAEHCAECAQECEAIGQAVALLAEGLAPVDPPAAAKERLFAALDDSLATPTNARDARPTRDRSLIVYAATAVCAAALGVIVTRLVVAPAADDGSSIVVQGEGQPADGLGAEEWRRRVARAEQEFGAPRARLASVAIESSDPELNAVVFYDALAQQMHVLVSGVRVESDANALWVWFRDADQRVLFAGPLESLGDRQAAGVVDVGGDLPTLRDVLLTEEAAPVGSSPAGRIVGRADVGPSP